MAYIDDAESKHLKRGKFGPLDVYPQEDKQKEDELSADFVKSGFKYLIPELLREHEYQGIAKDQPLLNNANFDNDVVRLLLQIVNKKEEVSVNSQIEANKKQQGPPKAAQTFRSSLILITGNQKTKEAAYAWFKQLANNEPLAKLAKKVPVFNKRADNLPEILITLYEYQVPITRAVWYLKIMVFACSTNLNDATKKKRQPNIDVSNEWSLPLIKFLREIFNRLQSIEQQQLSNGSSAPSSFSLESFMNVENLSLILLPVITHSYLTEQKLKCLWNFTTKLMRAMLDQNLLDKQFILESLIDLLEKSSNISSAPVVSLQQQQKISTSQTLQPANVSTVQATPLNDFFSTKLVITTVLQNMYYFLQSELLSRRLAYFCCKRISLLFNEYSNCFFESAITQLQSKFIQPSSTQNGSLPLKSSNILNQSLPTTSNSLQQQQQQKSPELNQTTKLKPFVTNSSILTNQSKLQPNAAKPMINMSPVTSNGQTVPVAGEASSTSCPNEIVNHILKKYVPVNSIKHLFDKFIEQPQHRDQVILLTSIVHAIQLGSMQSLIWNNVGDGKTESPYNGSPLDYLPCPPSRLIYTYDYFGCNKRTKKYVRTELEKAELSIKRRSIAVENKWTTEKLKLASIGIMQNKILAILDVLDKHCYDLTDVNDTIETLYKQIFPQIKLYNKKKYDEYNSRMNAKSNLNADESTTNPASTASTGTSSSLLNNSDNLTKTNSNANSTANKDDFDYYDDDANNSSYVDEEENEINKPLTDREIIHLLCDWATTSKRCGLHRIYYIVFLIKKRQIDLINQFKEANEAIKNKIITKLTRKKSKKSKNGAKKFQGQSFKLETTNGSEDINLKKRKLNESDESLVKKEENPGKLNDNTTTNNSNSISLPSTATSASAQITNNSYLNSAKKIKLEKNGDSSFEAMDSSKISVSSINTKLSNALTSNNIELKKSPTSIAGVNNKNTKSQRIQRKILKLRRKRLIKLRIKKLKIQKLKEALEVKSYEYLFQNVLFEYLETKAPCYDESSHESRYKFANLIALYHMFINCKIFSHDQFVSTLISRGETFRNNLNDIKRPVRLLSSKRANANRQMQPTSSQIAGHSMAPNSSFSNLSSQRQQMPNSSNQMANQQLTKFNSVDYSSPMSVYQQQPASMPPYNLPPHTPLQHQKSLSNLASDTIYVGPNSVPTPSKSSSINVNNNNNNTLDDYRQQLSVNNNNNLNSSYDMNKSIQQPSSVRPPNSQMNAANSNNKAISSNNSNCNQANKQLARKNNIYNKPMTKLAEYVLNFPVPQSQQYQHERNQRFVVLYGFGTKKQEILEKLNTMTKNLKHLFSRKLSIDLNDTTTIQSLSNSNLKQNFYNSNMNNLKKHYNTITTSNFVLTSTELERLNQLSVQYGKLSYYDQYSIINKLNLFLIDIYKTIEQKNYLPKLQYIQFIFDLMESNLNIFNLLLFSIRLLHVGPLIEQYLKSKFQQQLNSNNTLGSGGVGSNGNGNSTNQASSNKICYFEYLSYFYLNIIGVLRLHLLSLVLWKELAMQVFKSLFRLVKNVERPSKCSSHEKCALMLLNEMYGACGYLKQAFPQFEAFANKIKIEKCFTQIPSLDKVNLNSANYQMKSDEMLTSMITTTDYTIDEIESYITSKSLYYNFVAHVFVSISNLTKDEMLRVANLCAELTSRCSILITFWHNASKALHHRNTEPTRERAMFNELLNKINIQNPRCKENFKLFLSVLASRHCLILNELIIMVVKTCVMACPGITPDQSHNYTILEPSASLACHIIQYLFTSAPKPLQYRKSTYDQRMITASLRSICFNSFLLVLKCLFLLSEPLNKGTSSSNSNSNSNSSSSNSNQSANRNRNANSNKFQSETNEGEQLDLDQFSSTVLLEICEHDWIKERCFNEGDNLLKQNQLLEPALGRRAQNLLHIICYPQSHHLRKQNEQPSTKDFIKNILQNLDLWTLRESLLEFKLMFELEKQRDRYFEYFVECLAKTTVDFLIDPEKPPNQANNTTSHHSHHHSIQRSNSSSVNPSTSNTNSNNASNPNSNSNKDECMEKQNSIGSSDQNQNNLDDVDNITDPQSLKSPATNLNPPGSMAPQDQSQNNAEMANNNENNALTDTLMNNDQMNVNFNGDIQNNDKMLVEEELNDSYYEIDPFDQHDDDEAGDDILESNNNQNSRDGYSNNQSHSMGAWLIAPLITKLPDACQCKVLEHSSKILQDMGKSFWNAKTKVEKEAQAIKNITAWNQQSFFTLLISCLKNKENERPILTSLFNGLTDFISHAKEDKILTEEPRLKQIIMNTLHIRLSLVGSMFDFILKNSNDFINWAWLFVNLIYSGVVDPDNDQLLFTMIIDMLVVLIHHIITLEPNLDTNKHYQSIIKKISKETKDFSDVPNTKAINFIRRLMPLNRNASLDVLTVDPYVTTTSKTFTSLHDKRRGFKFARKEKISTWELIEGVKNASSLCSSWYGSAKLERKMLKYEFQQKLLLRHKHMNIHKELGYFREKTEVQNDIIEINEPVLPVARTPPPPAPIQTTQIIDPHSTILQKQLIMDNSQQMKSSPQLNTSSDDVVVIGSSTLTPNQNQMNANHNHPLHQQQQVHGMMHNGPPHAQQPPGIMNQPPHMMMHHQSHQNQMIHSQQPQQSHSQIINRLQQQVQHQQQLQQQQQQQNPLQMQYQQNPQLISASQNPNDNLSLKNSQNVSTPEKQGRGAAAGTGSTKKRTPKRRNAANAAATTTGAPNNPPPSQQPGMPPHSLGVQSQQQKPLVMQQQPSQQQQISGGPGMNMNMNHLQLQQQQMLKQQQSNPGNVVPPVQAPIRSTNSPMLAQQPQAMPNQQQFINQNTNQFQQGMPGNQPQLNRVPSQIQPNPMLAQQQIRPQINPGVNSAAPNALPNQNANFIASNNPGQGYPQQQQQQFMQQQPNIRANMMQPGNRMPGASTLPQPGPTGNLINNQPVINPNANQRKLPIQQQQPQQAQQVQPQQLKQQQQQQQQPGYSANVNVGGPQQQQQQQQMYTGSTNINMQQPRTTTPDPNLMMQQQSKQLQPTNNYPPLNQQQQRMQMQQQQPMQQQQQQRMQFNNNVNLPPGGNVGAMQQQQTPNNQQLNQNQMINQQQQQQWQQPKPQQVLQQTQQQQQRFQQQQQQQPQQQQQQFIQKQPMPNGLIQNNMPQQQQQQQQNQQQRHLITQQQGQQQYQNY